jgi:uncharacterized protein with NRDE domain
MMSWDTNDQEATDCLSAAGMDLESGREGGTWMAMNTRGQIAALLNVLRPVNKVAHGKRNRGTDNKHSFSWI